MESQLNNLTFVFILLIYLFQDSDENNTTVEVNPAIKAGSGSESSSGSSNDESSDESSDSNAEDPVAKLSDSKLKLKKEVQNLKLENKNLKTQMAVIWNEHKTKNTGLENNIQKLEMKLKEVQQHLQQEKRKNEALQGALVNASTHSG